MTLISPKAVAEAWGVSTNDKAVRQFLIENAREVHSFPSGKGGIGRLYERSEVVGRLADFEMWQKKRLAQDSQPHRASTSNLNSWHDFKREFREQRQTIITMSAKLDKLLAALGEKSD